MLDGAARVRDVVAAAADDDQPAVAITDHGVMYGVIDFVKAADEVGIKPIIGVEAYVTPGSRFDRPRRAENIRHHMTLLAENETGYRNLMRLVSRAYLDGYYYKPRMDAELLAANAEGIIATSGCLGGPVAQQLAPDASREEGNLSLGRDFEAAVATAAMYRDIFGPENFFIEIQDHGLEAQRRIMPDLVDISKMTGVPLLAANDAHYTRKSEAEAHDVLLCIQTGATINEPNRFKFDAKEFYLKSAAEMRAIFPSDSYEGACDNTLLVAERADVKLEFGNLLLPEFAVPDGYTEAGYLKELAYHGARERYGDPLPDEVVERVEHELRIIEDMGFPAYFLIVWDLIRYARECGIRTGPGRGSAAGSIVSYCLRITDLDPLRYGLIFERFLNPGRREMPDIDMDFDERYRADVIRYAAEKYGSDHVAQVVTFSTIKGKQAIRDSARVLDLPYSLGDRVAKMMPPSILGREASLAQVLDELGPYADSHERDWHANASPLRDAYTDEPDVRRVLDSARGLEGLRRQDGIHAAAVVISPRSLIDLVPIQQKGEGAEIVTQYEMHGIEALGLLKMDFLGLRNLSTIERALELIAEEGGEAVDIDAIPLDDDKTFEVFTSGDTIGVFQVESPAMRSISRNLAPDRFDDVIALMALFRPGPMGQNMHISYPNRKHGREPVTYPHPAIAGILEGTYGLMVYQEQVMQVAQEMAGYSMAEAEMLRKAMGKKVPAIMSEERQKFVQGCIDKGHSEKLGAELFDAIEPFAGYGFNKSHSAAYGLIAYQTAWLKAHYPAEYMSALLTSTKKDKDRTAVYLNECRTMGLAVLTPDVNESRMDFSVGTDGAIRFGLSAVRNVGEGVVDKIIAARSDGFFADFQDFANRVEQTALNKRTIESLIKSGAFDGFNVPRRGLMLVFEQILEATLTRRRSEDAGQFSLFGDGSGLDTADPVVIPSDEWDKSLRLGFEKEMLGLYVSDHPLLGAGAALRRSTTSSVADLESLGEGVGVTIGGLVGAITRRFTKKGEPMVFFQLEDLEGSVEVLAFPRVAMEFGHLVAEDAILLVSGRLDHRGEDVKVVAQEIKQLELNTDESVRLEVPSQMLSEDMVKRLKGVLANHPGGTPVFLHMVSEKGHTIIRLSDDHRVEARSALYAELKELFGAKALI